LRQPRVDADPRALDLDERVADGHADGPYAWRSPGGSRTACEITRGADVSRDPTDPASTTTAAIGISHQA
jgi:hypothetical protein